MSAQVGGARENELPREIQIVYSSQPYHVYIAPADTLVLGTPPGGDPKAFLGLACSCGRILGYGFLALSLAASIISLIGLIASGSPIALVILLASLGYSVLARRLVKPGGCSPSGPPRVPEWLPRLVEEALEALESCRSGRGPCRGIIYFDGIRYNFHAARGGLARLLLGYDIRLAYAARRLLLGLGKDPCLGSQG